MAVLKLKYVTFLSALPALINFSNKVKLIDENFLSQYVH